MGEPNPKAQSIRITDRNIKLTFKAFILLERVLGSLIVIYLPIYYIYFFGTCQLLEVKL